MEPVVPSGEILPLTDVLMVEDDVIVKYIYEAPFVSVFWYGDDEIWAEVYIDGVPDQIGQDRLATAHSVAEALGYRSYSRNYGDWGQVLCRFSDSPDKGVIWALEEEMGLSAWSQ